jgi:hypothetical protein
MYNYACIYLLIAYIIMFTCRSFLLIKWYHRVRMLCGMAQLGAGDATMWYQSSSFDIEPSWAR